MEIKLVPCDIHRSQELTQLDVDELFDRFFFPLTKYCITPTKKQRGLGLSKLLCLVTSSDSDKNISEDLSNVNDINEELNMTISSLYFFAMKDTLSKTEIDNLSEYFKSEERLRRI